MPARERALVEFNEKVLKPDILGNEMWNSDKYKKHSTLTNAKKALASACTKTKEGKVNIDDKKIAEALILFVTRELLKATRIWIIGKEILTHEGILYRSSHEWEKLIKAFAEATHAWLEGHEFREIPDPLQELKVK
ncbi:1813_t:CDS:2 [Ambispora leptoticha]|uniref:1813_t:CDS:1 n=1 Tax=Ambispora leptoticha TaxID=144679 RepID=A0A9N9D3S6_9GLOM|nr:1813_t:CDS:2 [Ambispora leptoticha]